MEKNIEKYVSVKQNFLDKEVCQDIIEKLNRFNIWQKHDWKIYNPDQEQGSVLPSGENEPEVIPAENSLLKDVNRYLMPKIIEVLQEYVDNFKYEWFHNPFHVVSNLKFLKYSLNQTMKAHCDHIHDIFDGNVKGIPILSVIGTLNDDYKGGNLVMFGDKKINTKEGDLIIFPSLFLFPHEIKPITKGIRYSYIAWMW